jgi:hypothetical protein
MLNNKSIETNALKLRVLVELLLEGGILSISADHVNNTFNILVPIFRAYP